MEFGWQITASDGPLDRTAGFVSRDIAPEVSASRHEEASFWPQAPFGVKRVFHYLSGKLPPIRLNRPYAEFRIMPSAAGERQRGGHRILGVLGIIRAPTRRPEARRLA